MTEILAKLAQQNYLLSCLPLDVSDAVVDQAEFVSLPLAHKLVGAGEPIKRVYFLCDGVASIIVISRSGKMTEAGVVGSEGFVPSGALLDVNRSFTDVIMQLPGDALVLDIEACTALRKQYRIFEEIMTCFQHGLRTQVECTLLSNATQNVSQRLARWLLICHDRVAGNQLGLTHEFMSLMLAVRRPSVTEALHILEGHGFIRSERAKITIRNRDALVNYAGDTYGLPEEESDRIFQRFLSERRTVKRAARAASIF